MPRNGFHRDAAFGIFTVTKRSPFSSLLFIAMGSIVIGAGISTPVAHFFAFYYGVRPMSREFTAQTSIAAIGVGTAN